MYREIFCQLLCVQANSTRTTIVDECFRTITHEHDSVVLFYFYQAVDRTAKAFYASLLKQLLAKIIDVGRPCPEMVRDAIDYAYGLENRQPDVGELVTEIVMPLLSTFQNVFIILDGVDGCSQRDLACLWKYLRKIMEYHIPGSELKVVVSSRDHTNVAGYLPDTRRLRIDNGRNTRDIETFIDDEVALHAGHGRLLHDPSLQALVRHMLKERANGM